MLVVNSLSIEFSRYGSGWQKKTIRPVRDLSLEISAGEIVAVVGSSGSGKSLLAHAILGLLPHNASSRGQMFFRGEKLTPRRIKKLRGKHISLIPQSVAYLNPLSQVGRTVHRAAYLSVNSSDAATENTARAFSRYHLQDNVKSMYPFQISGGMARRVLTATATAGNAELLIADEPTTGLDPVVAGQSLQHLRELADAGKSVMLITHDIEAAVAISDRVAVVYAGTTVELSPIANFKRQGGLKHPYTRALWNALPQHEFSFEAGNQPGDDEAIAGCVFYERCGKRSDACLKEQKLLRMADDSQVRCCHA